MQLSNRLARINGDPGQDDGWAVYYRARDLLDAGEDVTMLSIGDHDIRTDALILDAMTEAARSGQTGYAPINGTKPLRDAIASRTAKRTGVPTGPDNIFVGNGGQGALFAAMMAATDPGDKIAIIDPFYTTYKPTVASVGCQLVIVAAEATNGFQIDQNRLVAQTKGCKALLVNTPNNPTGAVYNQRSLEAIRQACLENDLWLISDEVYDSQVHEGTHISPRALPDMAERTFVIGSLSKSHVMTGFRLGWCIGPAEIMPAFTDLTNATTYGAPGFIQHAATAALTQGDAIEAETAAMYTRRRDRALSALEGQNILRVSPPEGAMYVMLDVGATGMSGEDFALALLDQHRIAVMPGESFGTAAAGHIRVALTINDDRLESALRTIVAFAKEMRP